MIKIKQNDKVSLYYEAPNGQGYVAIKGRAVLIDDPDKKQIYWNKEWERFYKDSKDSYLLIKVIPKRLEVVDYKKGIVSSAKTWEAPYVEFRHKM